MINKQFIPQVLPPKVKSSWKDYQLTEAFLSMKGDKKKWSEIAFTLKYTGNNTLINLTLGSLFKSPVITIDFSSDKIKIILFCLVTNLI